MVEAHSENLNRMFLDGGEVPMNELRFSIHTDIDAVTIQLAGSLSGVDVETVYQAWQDEAWNDALRPVIVDINMITEADEHGRALLVMMHRLGAQIIAKSPESSAIAQPIVTEHVESAISNPGWFHRLVTLFQNGRTRKAKFPLQAEMICRILAH
jgi:hypothetical protein